MVGLMGVGKSTWVDKHNRGHNDTGLVLSSDMIRLEKFSTLHGSTNKDNNRVVFNAMEGMLNDFYKSDEYTHAYYDATNLSRRRRSNLYTKAKKHGVHVVTVTQLKPLDELFRINSQRTEDKQVPEQVIRDRYMTLDVPRLGVDCDEMLVEGEFKDFIEEIALNIGKPHDSPYHKETIQEHINLTVKHSEGMVNQHILSEIAEFHDLGKSVSRAVNNEDRLDVNYFREVNGVYCVYYGHDKVSACYYLAYLNETGQLQTPDKLQILEAIYQHMTAHQGFSDKHIRRNKLTESDTELFMQFKGIDSKSKQVDEDIYTKFMSLKEEVKRMKEEGV